MSRLGTACSQVLVVRWSLDVLDVWLGWDLDSAVGELLVRNGLLALHKLTGALPVPGEATHVLQTGHLLVSQVSDDLEHVATVSVLTEDVLSDELSSEGALPDEGASEEAADNELGVHAVQS